MCFDIKQDIDGQTSITRAKVESSGTKILRSVATPTRRGPSRQTDQCSWLAEKVSAAELVCRQALLHNVCNRLLAVPADHRPRTCEAFSRFARQALKVRAYFVLPTDLLPHLDGVSDGVAIMLKNRSQLLPCPKEWLEAFPEQRVAVVKSLWTQLLTHERREEKQVCWIESRAFVERTYAAETVVAVLCVLGLVTCGTSSLDWSSLSTERRLDCLPAAPSIPNSSWSEQAAREANARIMMRTTRVVQFPRICAGAFIGKAGVGIKAVQADLAKQADKCRLLAPSSVKLSVSQTTPSLTFDFMWPQMKQQQQQQQQLQKEVTQRAEACAHALAASLKTRVTSLYVQQLELNAQRRERRACALEEAGRRFHKDRLAQRAMKKSAPDSSFVRGLDLPPQEVSRKMTAGRKQLVQQRRAMQCEKRQKMLKAWAALEQGLPLGRGCRQVRSDAKRFLRHVQLCRDEEFAEDAFRHVQACCHAGRPERQHLHSCQAEPRRSQRTTFGRGRGERAAILLAAGATDGAW